jgi:hypothetical protein
MNTRAVVREDTRQVSGSGTIRTIHSEKECDTEIA